MGCCEEARVSGKGRAIVDELGGDHEDFDEIMRPNSSKDDKNEGVKKVPRRQFPRSNKKVKPKDVIW